MMLPAGEAQARLIGLKEDAERVHQMMGSLVNRIQHIANGLDYLRVNGFAPERMPSTFMLANEVVKQQEAQISRIHSLRQGIDVMI